MGPETGNKVDFLKKTSEIEDAMRQDRLHYLDLVNSVELNPHLLNLTDDENLQNYADFLERNGSNLEYIDTREFDAAELYKRFHPKDKSFDPNNPWESEGFKDWLSSEHKIDAKGSEKFLSGGFRLIFPSGGTLTETQWRVFALLPESLHREMREASAWNMINSPDGKIDTKKVLYEDVDLVVIGASVGSVIASTMVASLNVNNITIVDSDIQDGCGDSRVDSPSLYNHGLAKSVKLRDSLLQVAPYLNYRIFTDKFTEENAEKILEGVIKNNPNRKLVVIEEVDDLRAKDLLRRKVRELYPNQENVLVMSFADIGRACVSGVFETPVDVPYGGSALKYTKDAYGNSGISKYETPELAPLIALAKIFGTYNLITNPTSGVNTSLFSGDLKVPIELVGALNDLLEGKIGSFQQSGLATRLAGVAASSALLAWLEGNLRTRKMFLDAFSLIDERYFDKDYLKEWFKKVIELQQKLGI